MKSWSRDPESGLNHNYINPTRLYKKHHFSLWCQLHITETSYISLMYFCFYWIEYIDVHLDGKTDKDIFEPCTITCLTATTTASAPDSPQEKKEPPNPWVIPVSHALDPLKTRKWMLQQPSGRPHTRRHPRIPEFCQDAPYLFYLIEEHLHHCNKESVTNCWKPLEVGLKLAITLRHQATGEIYTSFQYHWLVGRTTIWKFVPMSAEPSLQNSKMNICTVMKGKGWARSSEPDGMSPMLWVP